MEKFLKLKKSSPLPTLIAVTPSISEICKLEADALREFGKYPIEEWYNLGDFLKHRQLLFGARSESHRTPHDVAIPSVFCAIFKIARDALIAHNPKFGSIPDMPAGCAVNRYPTSTNGKGSGLGKHKDKGQWIPLVVGVTFVAGRRMMFSNRYEDQSVDHVITTERGSVYGFRDEMYSDWWHASLKNNIQSGTIYSITYRFT